MKDGEKKWPLKPIERDMEGQPLPPRGAFSPELAKAIEDEKRFGGTLGEGMEIELRKLAEARRLTCTPCGHPIPAGAKYLAVFKSDHGLLLKVGCEHQPVADVEKAEAVFGSGGCFTWWLGQLLNPCDHDNAREDA